METGGHLRHCETMRRTLILIVCVLLLAMGARLYESSTHSTWSDEGWNLWVSQDVAAVQIMARLADNHHPPAYFLSLAAWQSLVGDSRVALRMLSVLSGVLTVAVIYRAGVDAFGRGAGLVAAALFATFEQAVYYGQSMRHYGWLTLSVSLMVLFFLRVLCRPTRGVLIAYALSVAFGLYTMYLAALVAGLQALVGLFVWRGTLRQKRDLLLAYVGAGLLVLPWLVYAIPGQWHKVEVGVIGGYHNSFDTTPQHILDMSDILFGGQFALGAGLFVLAAWAILRARDARQFAVLTSGAGLFAAMLIVNLVVGILSERTLFFLLPSVLLIVGYGVQLLPARAGALLTGAWVAWMLVTPPGVVPTINSGLTAQTVLSGYSAGDFVLLETGFDDVAFEYEMHQTLPTENRRVFRSYYEYDYGSDAAMLDALNAALSETRRVWLVYWNVPPRLGAHLEAMGFARVQHTELPTGENDPLYTQYPVIAVSLYARPAADTTPRLFGEIFTLEDWHMASVVPADAPRALHVDLWWSALVPPERDYSAGVFLLDSAGVTRAEHIGPSRLTTTWGVGERVYDRHTLVLPPDLPAGDYTVIANVYWWETVEPLLTDGQPYLTLGTVTIR